MAETRKLAAILAADVAGYSKLAGLDEERTLARLRALRSDLIDPTIAVHHGRVVKRTGDGVLIEFRSVVDAVRCAIEVQNGMVERNTGLPPERRIEFRIGIHLGDVVEESDGDLMGDGVNIAARLEGIAKPGAICLSEDAYRQVKSRLDLAVSDLGVTQLKNIAEPVHIYSIEVGKPPQAKPTKPATLKPRMLVLLCADMVAFIAIGGSAWYFLGAIPPSNVSVECKQALLPIIVSPDETIQFINLFPLPAENGGGGLTTQFNRSGKEWKWPMDDAQSLAFLNAYRCELTNYGLVPKFDFEIELDLSFYEAVTPESHPNSKTYGKLKLHRGWLVPVSKIESGRENPFVFYIFNGTRDVIVNVRIPAAGTARQLGGDRRQAINLTVTKLGGEIPLQVWPNLTPSQ